MPHLNYSLDLVSDVYIVHGNRVLLRLHDKYGLWLPVGGHVEPGEDPVEAAKREVKEEAGLDVSLIDPLGSLDYQGFKPSPFACHRHPINSHHDHYSLCYVGITRTDKIRPADTETPTQFRWATQADLENPEEKYSTPIATNAMALKALKIVQSICSTGSSPLLYIEP
jgi:8-oxo-dGTP pyrophosphatase MutT (NUDIX family)